MRDRSKPSFFSLLHARRRLLDVDRAPLQAHTQPVFSIFSPSRDQQRSHLRPLLRVAAPSKARYTYEDAAKLAKHPVLGRIQALQVLLRSAGHGELRNEREARKKTEEKTVRVAR